MKKISLSEYKDYKQYFIMFDILIKSVNSNKEEFLQSLYLSPSSYRRAKNDGNKIGAQLAKELCKYFNLSLFTSKLIDEIEERFNLIYFNIYYKIYDTYEEDLTWIEDLLSKNYMFFPVLKLFKLLMLLNGFKNPNQIIDNYKQLFNEIKSYENFYNDSLLELLEILEVSFKSETENFDMSKSLKNELSYYTLSSKYALIGKHIESIYFCEKAKESFIKKENFKRVYYANLTLIFNYNCLCNFEEAYMLEKKQMLSLKSFNEYEFEFLSTRKHYIITCLGMKKYKEVLTMLENNEEMDLTEVCCYLISEYIVNKKEYENTIHDIIESNSNYNNKNLFTLLDKYLKSKDKKTLLRIQQYNINLTLKEILKKM